MAGPGAEMSGGLKGVKFADIDPDAPYPMDLPKLGHAVIVNNVAGSKADVEALSNSYQILGFEVQVHNDCGAQDMRRIKRWMMRDENHTDCNMFCLTVICHGNDKGHLLDREKKRAWETEDLIEDVSEVETLVGKPKLFVFQVVRTSRTSIIAVQPTLAWDDEVSDIILPNKADIFIAYSNVPGEMAYGDDQGSLFLQLFATYLQEQYMKRPLDRIYLMVRQAMAQMGQENHDMRQQAEVRNSLTRVLDFSVYHKSTGTAKGQQFEEDTLEKAYMNACRNGTVVVNSAKLNLVGHSKVGKSTFSERVLGQPFRELESTEGISTHLIKSTFNLEGSDAQVWNDTFLDTAEILKTFNNEVLATHDEFIRAKQVPEEEEILKEEFLKTPEVPTTVQKPSMLEEEAVDVSNENSEGVPRARAAQIEGMSQKTKDQLLLLQKQEKTQKMSMDYSLWLWDFGGQTEFLATHHLFLDAEPTTVIMLDISQKLEQPLFRSTEESVKNGIPNTPIQFLCYWLNTLHEKAMEKQIEPNLCLILTHVDLLEPKKREHYISQYKSDIIKYLGGKPYAGYLSMENIFTVDNRNGIDNDFSTLRIQLFKMFKKQKTWGRERPLRWLKLEADIIEKANEESAKYLQMAVVEQLASAYGITDTELEAFLQLHHSLGDFIYFPDPTLRDIVITEPQWLVDMFKTLITPHEFIDKRNLKPEIVAELKNATVTSKSLEVLWKGNNTLFLIELLTKFNLMLPLGPALDEDKCFLIPSILAPQNIDMYDTEPFKSMALVYNASHKSKSGEPLPVGTFHILLSKCSKNDQWRLCAEDHLSYTDASFETAENSRLALTLLKGTTVRASVWCMKSVIGMDTASFLLRIRNSFLQKLEKLNIDPGGTFLMLCPHSSAADEDVCLVKVAEVQEPGIPYCRIKACEKKCYFHRKTFEEYDFPRMPSAQESYGGDPDQLEKRRREDVSTLKSCTLRTLVEFGLPSSTEPTWGKCPAIIFKNQRKYIATVSCGERRTLQSPDSDVSLDIPEGSPGVFMTLVHTEYSRFRDVIPNEECVISPVVEVQHSEPPVEEESKVHVITIPHCVRKPELLKHIRVRRGNVYKCERFRDILSQEKRKEGKDHYTVDQYFITIYTRSFSEFTCTVCQTSCQATIMTFLLGNLEELEENNLTTVKVKAFLCSDLYRIRDFRKDLLEMQAPYGLVLVEEQDVDIERDGLDPGKSRITMVLSRAETEPMEWIPSETDDPDWIEGDKHFIKQKPLPRVMHLDGCHLCKSPYPRNAMTVNIKTTSLRPHFHGKFVMTVHAAVKKAKVKDDNGNEQQTQDVKYDDVRNRMLFTVSKEPSPVTSSEVGPTTQRANELSDITVLTLSQRLIDPVQILSLGLRLGVKEYIIDAYFVNNPNNITAVAHKTLCCWVRSQENRRKAFWNLGQALLDLELRSLAQEILNYPP